MLGKKDLIKLATEYVEREAQTQVRKVKVYKYFNFARISDAVLSVHTTDSDEPELWVVGGTTPLNLYSKKRSPSADEAYSFHLGLSLRMMERYGLLALDMPQHILRTISENPKVESSWNAFPSLLLHIAAGDSLSTMSGKIPG